MSSSAIVDMIARKCCGDELCGEEIQKLVDHIVEKSILQSQIGAMLMAVYFRGMSGRETADLTSAMMRSGHVMQWPAQWTVVDKHSTGGVGDKVSLVLAPCLAACRLHVPMISGRSLGHTGGTLDKLEAIPGFCVNQSSERMLECLKNVGCCIVSQTESIVPADKIIYAIRDVTNTVASTPLIVSSIISKKAAEGIKYLVLDVKCGSGAFMKSKDQAVEMAQALVKASQDLGIETRALVTRMEEPIGYAVGNSNEVAEAIECLRGKGSEYLRELVICLGSQLLQMTRKVEKTSAVSEIEQVLDDGRALSRFEQMICSQGVSEEVAQELCRGDPWKVLPLSKGVYKAEAITSGYVSRIDALKVAKISAALGCTGGTAESPIVHGAGVTLCVKIGDWVEKKQVWAIVHYNEGDDEEAAEIQQALTIEDQEPTIHPKILDIIGK